ncbi:MAG TPA: copper chaperone [Bacteroidetes bacterium]|nr:copper chaperone [Bacteroidota bacterium]
MKTVQLAIHGMTCGHCVMSLKKELSKIAGLTINSVEIGKANIEIDEIKVTHQSLQHAVEEAGYSVVSIQ